METKQILTTVDAHTAGEPLRIITGGIPFLKGKTILEKRAYFREHLDDIRKILMYEPRGHHGMYGCLVTPPVSEDADFGVLFMHNEGFSTMCGHGIIAVVTTLIETGQLQAKEKDSKFVIDSPAGKISAYAQCEGTTVKSVSFENVPSFVYAKDISVPISKISCTVDIVFGGAFYAIVSAEEIGLKVHISQLKDLQRRGKEIKEYINQSMLVEHPLEKELQGIYGVIISDKPEKANSHLRNVTIFADEQIDRSPCGTGTCARLAVLYSKGELNIGETFIHESIIGSQFIGEIVSTTEVGSYQAVIPKITGKASITGMHQFFVDPSDPLGEGFLL